MGASPIRPGEALVGVFSAPSDTFARLLAEPTWWLPFVLFVVLGVGSFAILSTRIDWERSADDVLARQAAKTGRAPAMNAEQLGPVMRTWGLASAPVVVVGQLFVVAFALWAAERAFGGEARYVGMLAMWAHANLANAAGALLVVAVALATPPASVSLTGIERLVKSSAGAFLPEGTAPPVLAFASSIDIFSLAALALLVVGFRRIKGVPPAAATALPIVLWLVFVFAKTGLAFLRG
jgi:Yip1-like protein